MSVRYEKARAIAEAAANRWEQFNDTAGIIWLADEIANILRQRDEWRALYEQTDPNQPTELCNCNIGDCVRLCRKCRQCASRSNELTGCDLEMRQASLVALRYEQQDWMDSILPLYRKRTPPPAEDLARQDVSK